MTASDGPKVPVGSRTIDEVLKVIDAIEYEYGGPVLIDALGSDRTTSDLRAEFLALRPLEPAGQYDEACEVCGRPSDTQWCPRCEQDDA